MGAIHLNNIIFHATHGLHPKEALVGTYFAVDLKITANIFKSYTSDAIEDTLNYQLVYEILEAEMKKPSKLIENLMYRIAEALKAQISFDTIEIKVTKHYPPVKGLNSVSVSDVF